MVDLAVLVFDRLKDKWELETFDRGSFCVKNGELIVSHKSNILKKYKEWRYVGFNERPSWGDTERK